MSGSLASARELHEKFNFIVTIDGVNNLYFNKCGELSKEIAVIEYSEGGALIPIKWPGRVKVADITLERGVGVSSDLHEWFTQVADLALHGGIGAGLEPFEFTRGVTIWQKARNKVDTRIKYKLHGCWPTKYIAGEWDNSVDEVVIEKLTIAFDRPQASPLV